MLGEFSSTSYGVFWARLKGLTTLTAALCQCLGKIFSVFAEVEVNVLESKKKMNRISDR